MVLGAVFKPKPGFQEAKVGTSVEREQTRTMAIYTEAKINRKMTRNSLRIHIPRANNT